MHQNKRRKILFLVIGMLADEGQLYEILEGVEKLNDGRVDVAVECESDPQKIYKILEFNRPDVLHICTDLVYEHLMFDKDKLGSVFVLLEGVVNIKCVIFGFLSSDELAKSIDLNWQYSGSIISKIAFGLVSDRLMVDFVVKFYEIFCFKNNELIRSFDKVVAGLILDDVSKKDIEKIYFANGQGHPVHEGHFFDE